MRDKCREPVHVVIVARIGLGVVDDQRFPGAQPTACGNSGAGRQTGRVEHRGGGAQTDAIDELVGFRIDQEQRAGLTTKQGRRLFDDQIQNPVVVEGQGEVARDLVQPGQLDVAPVQLAIEPGVFERGRRLRAQRSHQLEIVPVEGRMGCGAANGENADDALDGAGEGRRDEGNADHGRGALGLWKNVRTLRARRLAAPEHRLAMFHHPGDDVIAGRRREGRGRARSRPARGRHVQLVAVVVEKNERRRRPG